MAPLIGSFVWIGGLISAMARLFKPVGLSSHIRTTAFKGTEILSRRSDHRWRDRNQIVADRNRNRKEITEW